MSYRRQNSDFTRDRKRNTCDQILEDLKVKKKKRKKKENLKINLFLNSVSDTGRQVQRLTASILSGSERSAAPMPPCKRSEVRHPCHFFTAHLIPDHKPNWRQRFQSNIRSAERSMSQRSEGDPKWVQTPQKVTGEFRLRDGRLEETHLGGIFFGTSHVDIDGGHVFLPGWAAAHSFFPPKKRQQTPQHKSLLWTHTHRVVDSHQPGHGQRPVRVSGSLDKKKTRTTKNSQPSSSLCDWPPEVQQVSSVSPSGRQLCPSPAHRSWTWRDHRERQNPPCPTHLTQMQDNTVWVKRCRESASHSGSPAGEGHPPFTTRRHWAILMSISSWNRRTNQHLETELRL